MSGSEDHTVRVWSVETGELAFEPIKCHGSVFCARYSPNGNRIASAGENIQIWDAQTGNGILSIRNSSVFSLVWTADDTHVIGGGYRGITMWSSYTGEQLRTWKAYDTDHGVTTLSLSPSGAHLATANSDKKTAFVFDVSTGEQVAAFEHGKNIFGIAYSPSGKFIATGCNDMTVYVWEAPAVLEDPQSKAEKSRAPSFSWLLDRPAIPLAGPSRNNGRGLDGFWDGLPSRDQRASPSPQRVFNKVKDTLTNLFTRRPAGAAQTSPVRETVEPVEVAAGRDRVFWIIIVPIVWTPVKKLIYMLFFCRKPEEEDEEVPANTAANSSQAAAGNAATSEPPKCQDAVEGAGNVAAGPNSSPTPARNSVIRSQSERTASMGPSGAENQGAGQDLSQTPAVIRNQPESIEMVAIPQNTTVPLHASSQPTSSTNPLSPVVASLGASSSTVMSASFFASSDSARPVSAQSAHHGDIPVAVIVSLDELAILQEHRRRHATSTLVGTVAESISGSRHDHEPSVYSHPSTSLLRSPFTQNTSPTHRSTVLQPHPNPYAQSSQPLVGLDPLLNVVPSLRSPSLSSPSRHLQFLHPLTTTSNVQSMHLMGSPHDPLAEAPLESTTQLAMRQPANDEDID